MADKEPMMNYATYVNMTEFSLDTTKLVIDKYIDRKSSISHDEKEQLKQKNSVMTCHMKKNLRSREMLVKFLIYQKELTQELYSSMDALGVLQDEPDSLQSSMFYENHLTSIQSF